MLKRKHLKLLITIVVIFIVGMPCCIAEDVETGYNFKVIDTIDKANVRDAEKNGNAIGELDAGTPIVVLYQGPYFSAIEFNGEVQYIYNELIEPIEEGYVLPKPAKKPERQYSTEGTKEYRVKLTVSTWLNIRREKKDDAGSSGELYRGDIVYVKNIDSDGWAIIIWNSKKRFIKANLLEPVSEDMEVLSTPIGEYEIYNPKNDDSKTVYVRKAPSVKADIRKNYHVGTHVRVAEDFGAWAYITDTEGKELGYIMTFFLKPIDGK